jgi:hypothetical protein
MTTRETQRVVPILLSNSSFDGAPTPAAIAFPSLVDPPL